jgi:single-strand DNA-binding protein
MGSSKEDPMTSHENSVHLVGRVAADPEVREMPSGDTAVIWRLVVDRADPDARGRVDTLACIAWTASTRRAALRWRAGDTVEVDGALRRRFWRAATGPASRYEIEVSTARRIPGVAR